MKLLLKILFGLFVIYSVVGNNHKNTQPAHPLLELANLERETPLEQDDCLVRVATIRAKEMKSSGAWSHDGWQSTVLKCGMYKIAGENLVRDYNNFEEAHNALMNSPLHKRNIMNKKFAYMGVGCYDKLCVQLFKSK